MREHPEAFSELAADCLTDDDGYVPGLTYAACRSTSKTAWPDHAAASAAGSVPSASGRKARHVALNRSHAELHSVALAPDHALGSQLNRDAVDFGCVRENVIDAARDGQHEMVAIVEAAQGSMKATTCHGPGAVGGVVHCTTECGKSSVSSLAAEVDHG
ncbi:hypothetical protein [Stenotrophomonas maltophilia]|uniref:hypothetical protein n=1 Tax=Stenotrophomonas maltophilia TaxID=40324 RepID=UPI0015DED66B|nr:hypothetical protein [Stenotrophomonas maltophilia]